MVKKLLAQEESSGGRGACSNSDDQVTTLQTTGADGFSRPQEVVDVKDASSVVSGISISDFPDELEGNGEIQESVGETQGEQSDSNVDIKSGRGENEAAGGAQSDGGIQDGPVDFMSPPGKASRKVKKKTVFRKVKKSTTTTAAAPTADTDLFAVVDDCNVIEENDNIGSNKPPAKNGKVKVVKKMKSSEPDETKTRNKTIAADMAAAPIVPINALGSKDKDIVENKSTRSDKKMIKMKSSTAMFDAYDQPSTNCVTKKEELSSPSLSSHFRKEALKDGNDEIDDRSVRSGMKKKKNSKSLTSSSHSLGEERSIRSGTKKVKRLRSKSVDKTRNSDDKSVNTTQSRSRRGGRKKTDAVSVGGDTKANSTLLEEKLRVAARCGEEKKLTVSSGPILTDTDFIIDALKKENEVLLAETALLRKQMNDVYNSGNNGTNLITQTEVDRLKADLKLSLNGSKELKQELEDCEEVMVEKDRLIKKLTDAVDAQLDKVEHLELKLQRAEEEFCNMEDEMKDMEDVIDIMRNELGSRGEEKIVRREVEDKEKNLKERGDISSSNATSSPIINDLETKITEMKTRNSALCEENDRLKKHARERHAKEQEIQEQRDEELRVIQIGINKQLQELDDENESLRLQIEGLKERKMSDDESFRQQIEDLRKQITRLEIVTQPAGSLDGNAPSNEYIYELQVEIADLREKIVEQEDHCRRQKEEIALVFIENEEIKQDLREREVELRDLNAQISESKATSAKKMNQKDETIAFMQAEMMRIMQEKQRADKLLRERKVNENEYDLTTSSNRNGVDEEAEKAKLQAINDQLQQLNDENQSLEEKLKEVQYTSSMRLKEKQGILLDLQEELNDAKWELGARKEGADYITLLKDRKDRKKDLDKARKDLKRAEERMSDFERENNSLAVQKQDLEKEVESLNKSVLSMDSGEYVAGLKRQNTSLKQHNMALERKVQVDGRDADEKIRLRDAKIRILEHDIEKLKNPTRAALKSVFYSFGKNETENETTTFSVESIVFKCHDADDLNTEKSAESLSQAKSPLIISKTEKGVDDGEKNEYDQERKGGRIWNLFSPRRSTPRTTRNSGLRRLGWEATLWTEDPTNKDTRETSAESATVVDKAPGVGNGTIEETRPTDDKQTNKAESEESIDNTGAIKEADVEIKFSQDNETAERAGDESVYDNEETTPPDELQIREESEGEAATFGWNDAIGTESNDQSPSPLDSDGYNANLTESVVERAREKLVRV